MRLYECESNCSIYISSYDEPTNWDELSHEEQCLHQCGFEHQIIAEFMRSPFTIEQESAVSQLYQYNAGEETEHLEETELFIYFHSLLRFFLH